MNARLSVTAALLSSCCVCYHVTGASHVCRPGTHAARLQHRVRVLRLRRFMVSPFPFGIAVVWMGHAAWAFHDDAAAHILALRYKHCYGQSRACGYQHFLPCALSEVVVIDSRHCFKSGDGESLQCQSATRTESQTHSRPRAGQLRGCHWQCFCVHK